MASLNTRDISTRKVNARSPRVDWPDLLLQWAAIVMALSFVLLSVTLARCLASEPPRQEVGNFFTVPQEFSETSPTFKAGQGGGGPLQRIFGDDVPGLQQVQQIPGLSPMQRREIKRIYEGAREEFKARRQLFQSLRGDPAASEKIGQLKEEVRQKRLQTWHMVEALLTPEQLQRFEMMRKGQLTVSGLRRP